MEDSRLVRKVAHKLGNRVMVCMLNISMSLPLFPLLIESMCLYSRDTQSMHCNSLCHQQRTQQVMQHNMLAGQHKIMHCKSQNMFIYLVFSASSSSRCSAVWPQDKYLPLLALLLQQVLTSFPQQRLLRFHDSLKHTRGGGGGGQNNTITSTFTHHITE